jgi:hypothetical protein
VIKTGKWAGSLDGRGVGLVVGEVTAFSRGPRVVNSLFLQEGPAKTGFLVNIYHMLTGVYQDPGADRGLLADSIH